MNRWHGKIAVVTGASAGIGASVAENLVNAGIIVVGLARRKDKLEELANKLKGGKGNFHYYVADISIEEDILAAFEWIKKNVGPISILINNAGVLRLAKLTEGETRLWKQVFDTNVIGLCIATREAIKDMKANNIDGHIININSVAGHKVLPIPKLSIYAPSKHAVTALTEALRHELIEEKSKIKITSISPGAVRTEINKASYEASNVEFTEELRNISEAMPKLDAQDLADAITYALSTPQHVQVSEITLRSVGERS